MILTTESVYSAEKASFELLKRLKQVEFENQDPTITNSNPQKFYEIDYYLQHWCVCMRELSETDTADPSYKQLCSKQGQGAIATDYRYMVVKKTKQRMVVIVSNGMCIFVIFNIMKRILY